MNKFLLSLALLVASTSAVADDVEIYTGRTTNIADPNVIFVFDTSGSMGTKDATGQDGSTTTRLQASKDAAISIISGLSDINISVMEFSTADSYYSPVYGQYVYRDSSKSSHLDKDYGGIVSVAMGGINDTDHKNRIINTIENLPADSYTPLLETYDEASRYLRGDDVKYGKHYGNISCSTEEKTLTVSGYWSQRLECVEYETNYTCTEWGYVWVKRRGRWVQQYQCTNYDAEVTDQCARYGYVNDEWVPGYEYKDQVQTCEYSSQAGYFYLSDEASYDENTGKYISPINDACQANHIIVFTDGESYQDNESDSHVHDLLDDIDSSKWLGKPGISATCKTTNPVSTLSDPSTSDSCLEEMALALYESDNIEDSKLTADDDTNVESVQRIITHTVGGFLDTRSTGGALATQRLSRAATYGGGIAATASDYNSLVTALQEVFLEISSTSGSFTAPSVAVNALNRLENSDELYYALFEPTANIGWSGNLKRYKLGSDGEIYDANGSPAVDQNTGFFADNATSFWTLSDVAPDGDDVAVGGAAGRMATNRNVYTHLGGNGSAINDPLLKTSGGSYAAATGITQTLFDVTMSDDEFLNMLLWANGLEKNSSGTLISRLAIEDPLHSRPVILHYGVLSDGESLDSTVYFGTNSGYLHAIDSNIDNPQERFAYIPKELLPNIYDYYETGKTLGKVYGLDGQISYYLAKDEGTKLIIEDGDQAIIYAGMRRGGRSYYALDVSDRDKPVYMWQIDGGSSGFAELGQTWSKMTPINMSPSAVGASSSESTMKVLVFGGGYDADEDNTNEASSTRITHDQGNAIFIVDALTGDLLWKASPNSDANLRLPAMTSGIVGNITPVDNNGDGNIDILYAADLGGRVWRIDFFSDGTQKGTLIADLNDSSIANNVRFFTSTDVSYMEDSNGIGRYVIALGSGYRAHPLNEVAEDNFYVLFDYMIDEDESVLKEALSNYSSLSRTDLANYNSYSSASREQKINGFYFPLPGTGEKALSDSITVDRNIYFTTYKPADLNNVSSCTGNTGEGQLYIIKLDLTADQGSDTDETPEPTCYGNNCIIDPPTEPVIENPDIPIPPGIPPEPELVYTHDEDSDCASTKTLLIGSASLELEACITVNKNYWHEVE